MEKIKLREEAKLQKQLECVSALPRVQQEFVGEMIDTVIQQQAS